MSNERCVAAYKQEHAAINKRRIRIVSTVGAQRNDRSPLF